MGDCPGAGSGDPRDYHQYGDQSNTVGKFEKHCPKCGKITIFFNKPNQHKNIDCQYCREPLVRWEIKRTV